MKSVRTMALALALAGAGAGSIFAQSPYYGSAPRSIAPLPQPAFMPTGAPTYRTANQPTPAVEDIGPMSDAPPAPQPEAYAPPAGHSAYGSHDEVVYGGDYADAMSGPCADDCCLPSCGPRWFGSVAGLIMTREDSDNYWTSYDENNNFNQIMNSDDADLDWAGGIDARIGHCLGCGNAWEIGYFGVWDMEGNSSVHSASDDIGTPMDVTNGTPQIGGTNANLFFDNAREHRISRTNDFHNVEVNWLHNYAGCSPYDPCGNRGLNVSFLGGFRYFRFDEEFQWGTLMGDAAAGGVDPNRTWGDNGGLNEAYLTVDSENNLYGFQVGARADYAFGRKLGLFVTPKMGIFGNHIETNAQLTRGDGLTEFDLSADKDRVSFLAQVDVGLNYAIGEHWSLYGGYRALGITGLALSDEQIPAFLVDQPGFQEVDDNSSIILHGAFAGAEFRY